MDFLDSLDLDTSLTKSNRMRSWYLYEQYKSLERNQKTAAEQLKEKSYQNQILFQELTERRARRRLYDHIDAVEASVPSFDSISSECASSNHDFLECMCDDQEHYIHRSVSVTDIETCDQDCFSHDDSQVYPLEDFKSIEDIQEECDSSIKSMISNRKFHQNLAKDLKKELEFVKNNIAENISLQLETVQSNIECLEKYDELYGDEKCSTKDEAKNKDNNNYDKYSIKSVTPGIIRYTEKCIGDNTVCTKYEDEENQPEDYNLNKSDTDIETYGNMFSLWSKLVSFAYQVTKLNHGNCYYDYSSQLLTAVLACDVLRKSVHRIFDILQPYVSPIKFATEDTPREHKIYKHVDIKCNVKEKKSLKSFDDKLCLHRKVKNRNRNYSSVKNCESQAGSPYKCGCYGVGNYPDLSSDVPRNMMDRWCRGFSEPGDTKRLDNYSARTPNTSSKLSEDYQSCPARVTNPMLKLASYFDSIDNT